MSTFEHDGETFWYDVAGRGDTGTPLLVLHGGLGLDHTYLRPALDQLAPLVRVTYLDFRANGRSTGDGVGLTMAQLAADVDALRDHLGLTEVSLFGHSYGGFVALEYALTYPDRLSRLVLCDTDTRGPTADTMVESLQRLGIDVDLLEAFNGPIETIDDLLGVFDIVEPAYFPHSPPGTARQGLSQTIYRHDGAEGGDAALAGWDVADRLSEIDVPTLVLVGADDFMFPPERARLLADGVRQAQLTVFESSGHLPLAEETPAFVEAVRRFLLSEDAGAGPASA